MQNHIYEIKVKNLQTFVVATNDETDNLEGLLTLKEISDIT